MSTGGEWIGRACSLGQSIGLARSASNKIVFDWQDTGAVSGAIELFTVGGTIAVTALGVCEMDLTAGSGTATLSLGTANAAEHFISGTTCTEIDTDEIWAPELAAKEGLWSGVASKWTILKDTDIGYTVGTAPIISGTIKFYAFWQPISPGSWLEVQQTKTTTL